MKWISSDWHFSHKSIIEYSNRPFLNTDEMNAACVNAVNAVVRPDDELYYLGDLAMALGSKPLDQLGRTIGHWRKINCKNVYWILGNHDFYQDFNLLRKPEALLELNHELDDKFKFIGSYLEFWYNKRLIVLHHYELAQWHKCHKDSIHFWGHSHSKPEDKFGVGRSMDVGYDAQGKWVISLDEAIDTVKDRTAVGHHEKEGVAP